MHLILINVSGLLAANRGAQRGGDIASILSAPGFALILSAPPAIALVWALYLVNLYFLSASGKFLTPKNTFLYIYMNRIVFSP